MPKLYADFFRWPYFQQDPDAYKKWMSNYYYFMIQGFDKTFGYMHYSSVKAMTWPKYWYVDVERRWVTLLCADGFAARTVRAVPNVQHMLVILNRRSLHRSSCSQLFAWSTRKGMLSR